LQNGSLIIADRIDRIFGGGIVSNLEKRSEEPSAAPHYTQTHRPAVNSQKFLPAQCQQRVGRILRRVIQKLLT
jgi:hypothetical protein